MEYIDIFDKDNNPTGQVKEKQRAHEDGDFHRTAHIWIMNNKNELLLQKRSATKKVHPNCWDMSCAGHIDAGERVKEGAIRELEEELGIKVGEDKLEYIATIKRTRNPKNMEFGYVYLLRCDKKVEEFTFNDGEVSEVKYIYFKNLERIDEDCKDFVVHKGEFKCLIEYIENSFNS